MFNNGDVRFDVRGGARERETMASSRSLMSTFAATRTPRSQQMIAGHRRAEVSLHRRGWYAGDSGTRALAVGALGRPARIGGLGWTDGCAAHARASSAGTPSAAPAGAVAMVIGWMGAKQKHVERVSGVWSAGPRPLADSVSIFQPSMRSIVDIARRKEELRDFAESLRETLCSSAPDCKTLFIHAMSNNGFFFLANVLHEINSARRTRIREIGSSSTAMSTVPRAPAGGEGSCCFLALGDEMDKVGNIALVIDSAPSRIDEDIAARGIMSAAMSQSSVGIEGRYPLLYSLMTSALSFALKSATMTRRLREVQQEAWYGACEKVHTFFTIVRSAEQYGELSLNC